VRGSVANVDAAPLHPDLEPLAFLLGTWSGGGSGDYPTIDAFDYDERMDFEHVGDPFLLYSQQSWLTGAGDDDDDGMALHFERGFLRPAGPGGVELTLAHPLGLVEVAEGTLAGSEYRTSSTTMGRTTTGDPVTRIDRRLAVHGDLMRYELEMQTEETALTLHLSGELRRLGA
jgi:THAP4-like, heme-binding beta-barrel domain